VNLFAAGTGLNRDLLAMALWRVSGLNRGSLRYYQNRNLIQRAIGVLAFESCVLVIMFHVSSL
jgi:hypothetical protein